MLTFSYGRALQHAALLTWNGEASRVAPLDKLSVVLVAVFAFVFLGERLSSLHWIGVALIAAGAIMLAIK